MATPNVDPNKIPKRMSRYQLEDWIVFGICVANKEATQTRKKVDALYELLWNRELDSALLEFPATGPFVRLRRAIDGGYLTESIRKIKLGQYRRIERAFREVINLDLDSISVEMLESVHGIGPKTARMIMLYYDPTLEVMPLDTHVLKYLRKLRYKNVPKMTPSAGPTYRKWEQICIEEAEAHGMTVRDFDTWIWQQYAVALNKKK